MPFVGAAIVPHSPLLLPSIGKEYSKQTKKTQRALVTIGHELYGLQPDVLVIIHPHGQRLEGTFSVNVADRFTIDFKDFGDLVTAASRPGAVSLAGRLKERAEDSGLPLTLIHDPSLGYASGVPLVLAAPQLINVALLPVRPSTLDPTTHVHFGRLLAEEFYLWRQRVVVIASAELSHHLTAVAPGGERPEGKTFDALVLRTLGKKPWAERLLRIDDLTVERADACGYLPLLMLAGMVTRINMTIRKLAYEHPFGIGLLSASLSLT